MTGTAAGHHSTRFPTGEHTLPPPDPKLFATYDGSVGTPKPGDAAGAHLQGAQNVVSKVKDALTGDDH